MHCEIFGAAKHNVTVPKTVFPLEMSSNGLKKNTLNIRSEIWQRTLSDCTF